MGEIPGDERRSSPRPFTKIFRKMMEIHLLCVSGADTETWKDSTPVFFLQSSSTRSLFTSQDPRGLSDLADTSSVGVPCLDNASRIGG